MTSTATFWQPVPLSLGYVKRIPQAPGLYAISEVRRVKKLPVEVKILYIGRSLNLRRRFGEHLDPTKEHSVHLNRAVRWSARLEFWFAEFDQGQLPKLEKQMIQTTQPLLNVVRYGGSNVGHPG